MKRIALVGFAPSYVDAPFGDTSIDIWTMNYHHRSVPRTSRIIELHDMATIVAEGHLESLREATVPVYMQKQEPLIPTSVEYPLAALSAKYAIPHADKPYFTNTASYMIALAMEELESGDELSLYGIDLAHDTEYGTQRPSCEFFLGIAFGRGIRIVPHRSSDLLKAVFLYGYEDTKRDWFREKLDARRKHLTDMHAHHMTQLDQHRQALNEFNGALQDLNHIAKVWAG